MNLLRRLERLERACRRPVESLTDAELDRRIAELAPRVAPLVGLTAEELLAMDARQAIALMREKRP